MLRKFLPVLVLLTLIVGYEGWRARGSSSDRPRAADVAADCAERPAMPPFAIATETASVETANAKEGKIRRGTSFFDEMRRLGVSPVEIHRIVASCKPVFDFKRIRPGQNYSVYLDDGGEVDSLYFAIDGERVLKVNRSADSFAARTDTTAYWIKHYVTSGTIRNSIYATLQNQGANPELASILAVIFQWDIDFFTDIRPGDTFSILYENRVYANGKTALGNVLAARVFTRGSEHYAVAYSDQSGRRNYYDERGNSLQKSLLRAPLHYRRISSNFTHRRLHPVTHTYKPHLGVDYVAPVGTPVHSTGDGTVVEATRNRANGNYVKIKHNSRYTTYYLHLRGFAKGIRAGRHVSQGQVIGYLGSTGLVTAPHLDYRIKVSGRFVNPRTIKLPSREPVAKNELVFFEVTRDACLLRFFEVTEEMRTTLVAAPRPPLQSRIAVSL